MGNLTSFKASPIVVESVTGVVTHVVKPATGGLKTLEGGVVKEVASATDEPAPTLLDKIQDSLVDVATEVAKGAETAVGAVEQHPELIAEYVFFLIQPGKRLIS